MNIKADLLYYKSYELHPNEDWVVFVHGAGGSSSVWVKQFKQFKQNFNVLMIDLRGHGRSKHLSREKTYYTFENLSQDIVNVLDELKIRSAHFIGVSLGTILVRTIGEIAPEKILSIIQAGAIMKLTAYPQLLMWFGTKLKSFIPYMWLYSIFAYAIMPRRNHRESRSLFINEAKMMNQHEFIRWFRLTSEVNPLLRYFRQKELKTPTLYLMGDQDHLFLGPIRKMLNSHENSQLAVLKESGHVCNIDQPDSFNIESILFIKKHRSHAAIKATA